MRKQHLLAKALHLGGGTAILNQYWGAQRLTVLAYHRIIDVNTPGFDHYIPNVSASPEMFARQMDYVTRHFNVISLGDLRRFVKSGDPLPDRALLITFDDGYLDNYENAFPVLKKHGFPAVIFLMTSRMDNPTRLPWWDEVAYSFYHTRINQADLPIIGLCNLAEDSIESREMLMAEIKKLPEAEKQAVLKELYATLDVEAPNSTPLFMNWDQVRELVAGSVACQPHTVWHPILTRIPPEQAREEILTSRDHIRVQTDQDAIAFAYPNGMPGDYDATTIQILREADYELAFTLSPGPARYDEARERPLEIARVFLSYKDTFEIFVAKVMGLPLLISSIG